MEMFLLHFIHSHLKHSNQYSIVSANSLQSLIIPLKKSGKDDIFANKEISYDHNWIKEHKNALQTAYGKSPFFEYYDYKLFQIFDKKHPYLWELNLNIMNMIFPYLGWQNNEIIEFQTSYMSLISKINSVTSLKYLPNNTSPNIITYSKKIPEYAQVFDSKLGFQPSVCILDLLFNLGPLSNEYFKNV
jgi:hypothetical protein